jgi:hypothetical protein
MFYLTVTQTLDKIYIKISQSLKKQDKNDAHSK